MTEVPIPPLTADQQRDALTILVVTGSRETAAEFCGCKVEAIERHEQDHPEFEEKVRKSKLKPELRILKSLMLAAEDPKQWRAALPALELLNPERYSLRRRNEITKTDIGYFVDQIVDILQTELNVTIAEKVVKKINELITPIILPKKGPQHDHQSTSNDATHSITQSGVVENAE